MNKLTRTPEVSQSEWVSKVLSRAKRILSKFGIPNERKSRTTEFFAPDAIKPNLLVNPHIIDDTVDIRLVPNADECTMTIDVHYPAFDNSNRILTGSAGFDVNHEYTAAYYAMMCIDTAYTKPFKVNANDWKSYDQYVSNIAAFLRHSMDMSRHEVLKMALPILFTRLKNSTNVLNETTFDNIQENPFDFTEYMVDLGKGFWVSPELMGMVSRCVRELAVNCIF